MNIDNNELENLQSMYKLIVENKESSEREEDYEETPVDKLKAVAGSKGIYGRSMGGLPGDPSIDEDGPSDDEINALSEELGLDLSADDIHNHPDRVTLMTLIDYILHRRGEERRGAEEFSDFE